MEVALKDNRLSTPTDYGTVPIWKRMFAKSSGGEISTSKDSITVDNSLGGRISEGIAHWLGTPAFIFWLTIFCIVWIGWNTYGPESFRFDSAAFGFTALTLMLSLQASYAAPLILLAQQRQDARDKVSIQQDRERAERNLVDTEFLMREIASIRNQMQEVATRDYIRQELRQLLSELEKSNDSVDGG